MKFRVRFDAVVAEFLQIELAERPRFRRQAADTVAGRITHAQRLHERGMLLWCGMQFDNGTKLHTALYRRRETKTIV